MKTKMVLVLLAVATCLPVLAVRAGDANGPAAPDLEAILAGLEDRYAGAGFAADFFQASTIKAMEITDTATGKLFIKRPGRMRWEYETPDRQIIVSDGSQLWIYRPDDRQVMIGEAPAFFGDGRGASFLTDLKQLRRQFRITRQSEGDAAHYVLDLVPVAPSFDLARVRLLISKKHFDIERIVSYNAYDDETRIELKNIRCNLDLADELFEFKVPEGTEVTRMAP